MIKILLSYKYIHAYAYVQVYVCMYVIVITFHMHFTIQKGITCTPILLATMCE